MQTEIIIPEQKTPFLPREFFLGEAKEDAEPEVLKGKGKDKKLNLRLVASEPFEKLIKSAYKKETLIEAIPEMLFNVVSNEKEVLDDCTIFGTRNRQCVSLNEVLWAWKYLFQKLVKGEVSPIVRNGLGNIWKVKRGKKTLKLFLCINFASKDVYMHVKEGRLWTSNHTFFIKKS